jgi:hypothetical protein
MHPDNRQLPEQPPQSLSTRLLQHLHHLLRFAFMSLRGAFVATKQSHTLWFDEIASPFRGSQ